MSGYQNQALVLGYQNYAEQQGAAYGLPPGLMSSIIQNESGWNGDAVNSQSGATGIMQFLPSTAANPGYGIAPFDPTDPFASMSAGAQYLAAVQQQTGSLAQALQQFSGGAAYASTLASQYGGTGASASASAQGSGSMNNAFFNEMTGTGTGTGASAGSGGVMAGIGRYVKEIGFVLLAIVVIGLGVFFLRKR